MKLKATGIFLTALAIFIFFSVPCAFAENDSADMMQVIREEIQADKKRFVAMNILFTKPESKQFWPLYGEYQKELEVLGGTYISIINDYEKNYLGMTDEMAASLLDRLIAAEMDFQNLRKSYLPRFRAILPERKVTQYFQLENKIQAVVRFDAAARIPL